MCAKAPTYSTPHKSFHNVGLESSDSFTVIDSFVVRSIMQTMTCCSTLSPLSHFIYKSLVSNQSFSITLPVVPLFLLQEPFGSFFGRTVLACSLGRLGGSVDTSCSVGADDERDSSRVIKTFGVNVFGSILTVSSKVWLSPAVASDSSVGIAAARSKRSNQSFLTSRGSP
jgi:hypothetical protein